MNTRFTETTMYRATLIENVKLKKELKDKSIELDVAKKLQMATIKTLYVVKDFGGVSTSDILVMITDFYTGDYE